MARPARVIVRTPPPSLEETAKKFGVSERELERVKRLVGRVVARSKGAVFGPLIAGPEGAMLFETWAGDPRPVPADKEGHARLLAERGIVKLPNPKFERPASAGDRTKKPGDVADYG